MNAYICRFTAFVNATSSSIALASCTSHCSVAYAVDASLMVLAPTVCLAVLSCDVIDNSDPHILYEGLWTPYTQLGSAEDHQGTLAFSNESQATATFQFTGTSVAVYGAVKPVGMWQMQSVYFLDALGNGTYQPNPVVSSEQHHVLFYASHQLAYGPHTLVIENEGEQFWFDYIVVGGQGDGPASSCATPLRYPPHSRSSRLQVLL
ncbi:hypothetical protein NUW54_g2173 [Trametes sanguinea]|uniref:Uncharacterized protein n=1 Tax=Trametes sanguinea TaxID=158606 RepID=A0ACC1Q4A1_9APHY|nr:hypothetical protein NUW54_g2173 [Trametes sanguinea]